MNNVDRILHIAYKLDDFSGGTRIAKFESPFCVFFLGRLSDSVFVRQRQIYPYPLAFLGILNHIINVLLAKSSLVDTNQVFSFDRESWFIKILIQKALKKYKINKVYLHWGGYNFFPIQILKSINVQVIIVAHDYLPFTGGCHIPFFCNQFTDDCANCPEVRERKRLKIARNRIQKNQILRNPNIFIRALSEFSKENIERTSLKIANDIIVKPNPVDENFNLSTNFCHNNFKVYQDRIKGDKSIRLFIPGVKFSRHDNKGSTKIFEIVSKVVSDLPLSKVSLITQGDRFYFGDICHHIHYEKLTITEMIDNYRKSDFVLVLSRFETFSQVTMESILCFTPVIAFDNSGPKSLIKDRQTGFLVPYMNYDKFSKIITDHFDFKLNNLNLISAESLKLFNKLISKSL